MLIKLAQTYQNIYDAMYSEPLKSGHRLFSIALSSTQYGLTTVQLTDLVNHLVIQKSAMWVNERTQQHFILI